MDYPPIQMIYIRKLLNQVDGSSENANGTIDEWAYLER